MKTILSAFALALALALAAGPAHADDDDRPPSHSARQLTREAALVVDAVSTAASCARRDETLSSGYVVTFKILRRVKGKAPREIAVWRGPSWLGWRGRIYLTAVDHHWEPVEWDAAVPSGHAKLQAPPRCLD